MTITERLRERLRTQGPAFIPSEADRSRIEAFFAGHPDSTDAYLFFDGRVLDGDSYRRSLSTRTRQLVAVSSDGIPVNVSRVHVNVSRL